MKLPIMMSKFLVLLSVRLISKISCTARLMSDRSKLMNVLG